MAVEHETSLVPREEAVKITEAKPLVVACIPAYNEEKTIGRVVLQTKKYADKVLVCVPAFNEEICIAVLDYLGMWGKLLLVTKRYIFVVFQLICR